MKKLMAVVIVAAAAWGGYWFFTAHVLKSRLTTIIAEQRAAGWRVAYDALDVRGFPSRLDTRVEGLVLSPPDSGLTWTAPIFQINALSYRPNHVIAVWPPSQRLAVSGIELTLTSADMRASAVVRPTGALPLDRINMVIEAPVLSAPSWTLAADRALFAIRAQPGDAARYHVGADLHGMRLSAAEGAPPIRGALHLDATLLLDRPIDRHAMASPLPAPRAIELRAFHGEWNGVELRSDGTITFDAAGRPTGELTLRTSDWRAALEQARAAGILTTETAARIAAALRLLAGAEELTLPLILDAGQARLGPVLLGPVPALRIDQRQ